MNRKELIEYKKGLKLTYYQRQVLIGTLLGDASIAKQLENRQYNVKFEQSIVKADYIDCLYKIFKDFVGSPPSVRDIRGGGARDRQSVWFRTYRHSEFTNLYNLFYKD